MEEERETTSVTGGTQMGEQTERGGGHGEDLWAKAAASVDALTLNSSGRSGSQAAEELLPGLSNDITLLQIAPKLPWSAFYTLAGVSRSWQAAIRSRQVFNARVASHSADTLIVFSESIQSNILLYCLRARRFYELPSAPLHQSDRLWVWRNAIALDGKIYLVSAQFMSSKERDCRDVYVFDLAEQRGWKQCAQMLQSRSSFPHGVFDGKIYVFGGSRDGPLMSESEMYDPKVDAWTRIAPAPTPIRGNIVATLGEEMYVKNGELRSWSCSWSLEVYNPVKDEWRAIQPIKKEGGLLFIAEGRFHRMTYKAGHAAIEVFDAEKSTWQHLQSCACYDQKLQLEQVTAVNGELVGLSQRYYDDPWVEGARVDCWLFRSDGFYTDRKEVSWDLERTFSRDVSLGCTVQL